MVAAAVCCSGVVWIEDVAAHGDGGDVIEGPAVWVWGLQGVVYCCAAEPADLLCSGDVLFEAAVGAAFVGALVHGLPAPGWWVASSAGWAKGGGVSADRGVFTGRGCLSAGCPALP